MQTYDVLLHVHSIGTLVTSTVHYTILSLLIV